MHKHARPLAESSRPAEVPQIPENHDNEDYTGCTILQDETDYGPITNIFTPNYNDGKTDAEMAPITNVARIKVHPPTMEDVDRAIELTKANNPEYTERQITHSITMHRYHYQHREETTYQSQQRDTLGSITRTLTGRTIANTPKQRHEEIVIRIAKLITHHKRIEEVFEEVKNDNKYLKQEYGNIYQKTLFFKEHGSRILELTAELRPDVVNKIYTKVIGSYTKRHRARQTIEIGLIWQEILGELQKAQSEVIHLNTPLQITTAETTTRRRGAASSRASTRDDLDIEDNVNQRRSLTNAIPSTDNTLQPQLMASSINAARVNTNTPTTSHQRTRHNDMPIEGRIRSTDVTSRRVSDRNMEASASREGASLFAEGLQTLNTQHQIQPRTRLTVQEIPVTEDERRSFAKDLERLNVPAHGSQQK